MNTSKDIPKTRSAIRIPHFLTMGSNSRASLEAWAAIHHLDQAPDMEPGLFFGKAPVDKVIKWYQLGWLTSQSTCF